MKQNRRCEIGETQFQILIVDPDRHMTLPVIGIQGILQLFQIDSHIYPPNALYNVTT